MEIMLILHDRLNGTDSVGYKKNAFITTIIFIVNKTLIHSYVTADNQLNAL